MRAATAIAAARAAGTVTLEPDSVATLEATCTRISRRIVSFAAGETAVAFATGYTPNLEDEAIQRYELPQTRLVALAVCLALCHDPARPLPGRTATVEQFEAIVSELVRGRQRLDGGDTIQSMRHVKGALVELHEMGYLRLLADTIELGPALAAWSETEWTEIQQLQEQLLANSA